MRGTGRSRLVAVLSASQIATSAGACTSAPRERSFELAILERDAFVCHWCGGEATSVDYLRALVDGGRALDESNAVASCLTCNFRRGAAITNRGGSRELSR